MTTLVSIPPVDLRGPPRPHSHRTPFATRTGKAGKGRKDDKATNATGPFSFRSHSSFMQMSIENGLPYASHISVDRLSDVDVSRRSTVGVPFPPHGPPNRVDAPASPLQRRIRARSDVVASTSHVANAFH